jgi:mannitol-1-phosphate 5-dehydrogenase
MVDRPILVFGAGNIGRGLLAELASRAGTPVVFVEAIRELADRLRRAGHYAVHLTGAFEETTVVRDYEVVDAADQAAVNTAVERAGLAAVAVGPRNLPAVAAILAPALATRGRDASSCSRGQPLPILVCENQHGADHTLANALLEHEARADTFACLAASIERMVRPAPASLDLYAEAGQSLYIDGEQWPAMFSGRPMPAGFTPVTRLDGYYARKLYTNNAGHALLAYLGHQRGCQTIAEAASDPAIAAPLQELLAAAARMLVLDYGLDSGELKQHVQELVTVRFANRALADPISRVARDPLRKLGPDDRMVGLLRRLRRHQLPTGAVCRAIAAAMHYRDAHDAQSLELAALIEEGGPESVLQSICGIAPDVPEFDAIVTDFYTQTVRRDL